MAQAKTNTQSRKMTKKQLLEERRKKRTDLGSMRDVMPMPTFEGADKYHWRWVNNDAKAGVNRVQKLMGLGYEIWTDREKFDVGQGTNVTESNVGLGSAVELPVGTSPTGDTMTATLMYIDKVLYEMDQEIKEDAIREKETGMLDEGQDDAGMYGGIRVG